MQHPARRPSSTSRRLTRGRLTRRLTGPNGRLVSLVAGVALAASTAITTATAAPATATATSTAAPGPGQASVATDPAGRAPVRDGWTARPATYPGSVKQTDLAIPMSDGTVLRGDLELPAGADGEPAAGRFPVLVTITAYNKSAVGAALGGGDYLVRRGYASLNVDARGTGSSEGTWDAFGEREQLDGKEVVEWAASRARSWSNGRVGMRGPSYMGINQLFTAALHPKGLQAIFPQVPAGDVYRDVVASGGQVDVGFIPLWMGLVTTTGVIPPAVTATDPASGIEALLSHVFGAATFTAPLLLDAVLGGDAAHDGPFYRTRSPLEVIDEVDVPTFLVGGQQDLFQRGTPLLFEALQERGVPTRLVVGPWNHLEGSMGTDIDQVGHGDLSELQLRWFDRWLRDAQDSKLGRIAPVNVYENGSGTWRTQREWISRDASARSYRLSGAATTGARHGVLTTGTPAPGTATVLPLPVSGLCTRSASQWTAGIPATLAGQLPCFQDNALNDRTGIVYETAPLARAVRFSGPVNARLYASSPTGGGMLSVSISDVSPSGRVTRLSGGWQLLAQRALDRRRTRFLDGEVLQPYHPFTRASRAPAPGKVVPVDVEVFPTAARIRPGHRLRIAVQAFDVPHLLPTLPDLPGSLTPITLHASADHPSRLTIPFLAGGRG
ncbi:CocE/NonD family hydrolase [Nocardioides sp. SOB77]|uniref:CocE/NonD family hydrolase n=1 Tax=Nocardioides oceani TaxID=3058369 RepID=A0ABT8FH89_9ACTN|nr:CocE/NonD family hydrolase [Nocardioides oceani]MDN4174043.1 CocE/NonD family hydrolase [Nocardioides oceani]